MLANLASVALHGSRSDIFIWHRYYIPSYAMAALLAGMGAQALVERLPRALRLLPLAVPAAGLLLGWRDFDRSRYRIAEDFSRPLLDTLPPGAHLAASDDNILFVADLPAAGGGPAPRRGPDPPGGGPRLAASPAA